MHHYVYYSFEEYGRGYIGSRSCKCEPDKDTRYFGSFRDKTFRPTQKIILATYETREEALKAEMSLHEFYEVHENPHFANRAKQTSTKFILCGDEAVKIGKKAKEMGVGIHAQTIEEKRALGLKAKEMGLGFHAMTKEELKESCSKGGRAGGKIGGRVGGKLTQEMGVGIHAQTIEEKRDLGKLGGKSTSAQKWQCTVTGFITNAGALTGYQRARNIDTSNRIRLP